MPIQGFVHKTFYLLRVITKLNLLEIEDYGISKNMIVGTWKRLYSEYYDMARVEDSIVFSNQEVGCYAKDGK